MTGDAPHAESDRDGEDLARFAELYPELRRIAASMIGSARHGTLPPTAVVHEVFLKLHRAGRLSLDDAGHFKALAARVMRQVLVDHARRRGAAARALIVIVQLRESHDSDGPAEELDVLELDAAIRALEAIDPRAMRVVDCRIFGGLTLEETAERLGVGRATVVNDWRFARAFLARELG